MKNNFNIPSHVYSSQDNSFGGRTKFTKGNTSFTTDRANVNDSIHIRSGISSNIGNNSSIESGLYGSTGRQGSFGGAFTFKKHF